MGPVELESTQIAGACLQGLGIGVVSNCAPYGKSGRHPARGELLVASFMRPTAEYRYELMPGNYIGCWTDEECVFGLP